MMTDDASGEGGERPRYPVVSIGVPVHNEAGFVEKTLSSLLQQTFSELEIQVSDNGSTDETYSIVESLAQSKPQLYCRRFETNQGAARNFNEVLDLAQGRFFMWASGHDLWTENLISECVDALEAHPDAVLAFPSSRWIDEHDEPVAHESGYLDTRGMGAVARFFAVFWGNMHPILGLIRTDCLRRAGRAKAIVGADLVVLCELALMGDFVHAARAIWSRREIRTEPSYADKLTRYRSAQFGLARSKLSRLFPLARLPLELIAVVLRAEISRLEKFLILTLLIPSLPVRYIAARFK